VDEKRQLMSVRTEVVLETLVGEITAAVQRRFAAPLPDDVEAALAGARDRLDPAMRDGSASPAVATRAARAGFLARVVERELFARAREPAPALYAELVDGEEAAAALASREALARPDPSDPDAVTWRVPGPGGHVRHYVAEGLLESECGVDASTGAGERTTLKRCWIYGFLLACMREDRGAPRT
jgi:hypothetical protein